MHWPSEMVLSGELLYDKVEECAKRLRKFSPKVARECVQLLDNAGNYFDEKTSLEMKSQFEAADADNSGKLSQSEFRPIAQEMMLNMQKAVGGWETAPTEADYENTFAMCDADGDGELDMYEFANLWCRCRFSRNLSQPPATNKTHATGSALTLCAIARECPP
eukprot:SAG11_NODE_6661_length_1271_cov_1.705631_2_plen_163_part_00